MTQGLPNPQIEAVSPAAAIAGGEIDLRGRGFSANGRTRPQVRIGGQPAGLLVSSPDRLVVRVPEGVTRGELTVEAGGAVSSPVAVAVGVPIAANLHPVANPAVDAEGNVYSTVSGTRGQKVPVAIYKLDRHGGVQPFLNNLVNPTGLAFDAAGMLYVSSRHEGTVYQVSPEGKRTVFAQGMGVATGLAFDAQGNLYVGDRSGTIFKISPNREIFVFATLEPSVSAYHLAFDAHGNLFVAGPTTSSYDRVYRITPAGEVGSFYQGLGRPQGMAFDAQGNLYVAASLEGRRGVVRFTPDAQAELAVSGHGIVGLAFTGPRSLVLATGSSLIELTLSAVNSA